MLTNQVLAAVRLVAFDFDGVFTDNSVYVMQDGAEAVRCWRSDGLGLTRLRKVGVVACILSTEVNPVVEARAKKLKLPFKQALDDKALAVRALAREFQVDLREIMFVGNDVNDIPAFRLVGLPVAVSDCHPAVYPHVYYRTQRCGGYGAVREICDLIVGAIGEVNPGGIEKL